MESKFKVLAILLVLGTSSIIIPKQAAAQPNVSYQVFYDQLSPYGQWINYSNYGYVWLPNAGSDFVPYSSAGHWIYTEYGWTWVSDYSWGWAPFHYGRWDFDSFYGWMWIPDNEWGPSWVTWRRGNGYYGWEPMGPGISISMSFGRSYNSHNDHWMFVRDRDFERSDINHYYVNSSEHITIIQNSIVINKTYIDSKRRTSYVSGPAREDVQKRTGRNVTQVTIQENSKPGQVSANGQLRIYRPVVYKSNVSDKKIVPARIVGLKEVKKYTERNSKTQTQNVAQPNSTGKQERLPQSVKPVKNYEKSTQTTRTPVATQGNNNKQTKSNYTVAAPNTNSVKTQPQRKQIATPPDNNRVKTQTSREQNVTPSNNNAVRTNPVKQQNVTPSNNNEVRTNPVKQQNVTPSNNNALRTNPVKQQNTPNQNKTNQTRPTNNPQPSNNARREQPRETNEKK